MDSLLSEPPGKPCIDMFLLTEVYSLYDSASGKESACNAGDLGWIPGLGRSLGERNGNPLQYSCLENFMDRRGQAAVHGIAKSQT